MNGVLLEDFTLQQYSSSRNIIPIGTQMFKSIDNQMKLLQLKENKMFINKNSKVNHKQTIWNLKMAN
jgi:hypothetical protein